MTILLERSRLRQNHCSAVKPSPDFPDQVLTRLRANGGSTSPRDCKAVTVPAAKSAVFAGSFGCRCLLLLKSCPQAGQDCVGMHTGVGAGTATLSRFRIGTATISVALPATPWPARRPTRRL